MEIFNRKPIHKTICTWYDSMLKTKKWVRTIIVWCKLLYMPDWTGHSSRKLSYILHFCIEKVWLFENAATKLTGLKKYRSLCKNRRSNNIAIIHTRVIISNVSYFVIRKSNDLARKGSNVSYCFETTIVLRKIQGLYANPHWELVFDSIAHWVQKAIKSQAKSMIRNLYDTGLWLVGTMCNQQ